MFMCLVSLVEVWNFWVYILYDSFTVMFIVVVVEDEFWFWSFLIIGVFNNVGDLRDC